MTSLPRVLILSSDVPHTGTAGAIILSRLFQEWPPDRLLAAGAPVSADAQKLACDYIQREPPLWRLEVSRFAKLSRLLTLFGARSALASSMHRLARFRPQVVVTIMQNLSYSQMAYDFALHNKVPLVVIVHDDPEDFERCYSWAASRIIARNARIYRHAHNRLCVSPEMRDLLQRRYGVEGEVLYPNRSELVVPRPAEEALSLKDRDYLTVGYAGTLNYGYGARLEELNPLFRK